MNKQIDPSLIVALSASPVVRAAENLAWWGNHSDDQLAGLVAELQQQASQVAGDNLSRGAETLVAHAHLLDAVLYRLTAMAAAEFQAGRDRSGRIAIRLALQAQDQARQTWDTIARLPRHGDAHGAT